MRHPNERTEQKHKKRKNLTMEREKCYHFYDLPILYDIDVMYHTHRDQERERETKAISMDFQRRVVYGEYEESTRKE